MITDQQAKSIRDLEDDYGHIEPGVLVRAARDPKHPCHDEFEWDDKIAALKNRIDTACRLIRQVPFMITTEHHEIRSVAYVADPMRPVRSRRYISMSVVSREKEMAQKHMLAEMHRVINAVERAKAHAQILGLSDQLNELLERIEPIVEAIRPRPRPGAGPKGPRGRGRRSSRDEPRPAA